MNIRFAQKIRLSADFLTGYNADAHYLDLNKNNISQTSNNVKYVDPTRIEPANPELSGLSVHQYQAHKSKITDTRNLSNLALPS